VTQPSLAGDRPEPYNQATMLSAILLLLASTPLPQDGSQKPQDQPFDFVPPPRDEIVYAADGNEAEPGRIPNGTTKRAAELWTRALAATSAGRPLTAFDLDFQVLIRRDDGTNDFDARYVYWDTPQGDYLRCEIGRTKRVQLRGPQGDFLIETKDGTINRVSLAGRENAESRRELDEWIAIARNFVALTQPDTVRLVRLQERPIDAQSKQAGNALQFTTGAALPLPTAALAKRARELDWIEVHSPDFRLYQSVTTGKQQPIYRALFGLDRETGAIELTALNEDDDGTIVLESAILVQIPNWKKLNGFGVPEQLMIYEVDPRQSPWGFKQRAVIDLWLKQGELNPQLTDADFTP